MTPRGVEVDDHGVILVVLGLEIALFQRQRLEWQRAHSQSPVVRLGRTHASLSRKNQNHSIVELIQKVSTQRKGSVRLALVAARSIHVCI